MELVSTTDPDFPCATWRAVLARLIPTDDAPGAIEAGVDQRLLDQGHGPTFADWLTALDAAAGGAFGDLDESTQDAFLQQIEAGEVPSVSASLFEELVSFAAEAFYSNPDDTSPTRTTLAWRMLGYSPRPSSPTTS